jgi:hypothetical protein
MLGRRLFPLLLLGCVLPLQAQVYTWVDENGQKHFGNQPPATQPIKEVKINQGYVSDGPPPTPVGSTSDSSMAGSSAAAGSADEKMCSEAIRWTGIDLPNLKDIARERKQQGKLTTDQYNQAVQGLDKAKSEITLKDCLASTGKEREQYKCLSGGAGVLVCSGALQDALNKQ